MKRLLFIAGCVSALFLAGCNKELSDNFNNYPDHPLNDTVWVRNVPFTAAVHELAQLLAPNLVVDSFETSKDTTLKYGDSLEVSFTAGSFVSSTGVPATTGKFRLEILRVRRKGDFIKAFVPTVSNGYPIESAGSFFVRVSREGKEMLLAPGASIKIRFSDIEDPKTGMMVFYGRESNPLPISGIDTAFSWSKGGDSAFLKTFQTSSQGGQALKGYELISKNLRWINADKFNDTSKPKTKITAILPLNYTNKNTAAFAVFTDQRTVMSLKADFASRSFAASNIPIGTKLKIVTISRIGDDMYLGSRDVNDVGSIAAYSVTPEKKGLKDILSYLGGL